MNTLQEASTIYKAFKKGGPAFAGWQMLPGTNHSRAIARSGVDLVVVDCEHGNIAGTEALSCYTRPRSSS
jgi:4-hydroxy-2-oxoheptanedioate aldolase